MILRHGVWYFTPAEVKGLLKKITKRRKQGRPPEAWIHERILEEYAAAVRDAAPKRVNKAEFSSKFCKKYGRHSPEGVKKQLDRLLLEKRREAEAKKKVGQK